MRVIACIVLTMLLFSGLAAADDDEQDRCNIISRIWTDYQYDNIIDGINNTTRDVSAVDISDLVPINENCTDILVSDPEANISTSISDQSITIQDNSKYKYIYDVAINYSDIKRFVDENNSTVTMIHTDINGDVDARWLQKVENIDGYAVFKDLPFSGITVTFSGGDTLLRYYSKYVVSSSTAKTTTSSTLGDDTYASQTFSLPSTKTVLAIYTATSAHSDTNNVDGITNAINIDGTDRSTMTDSGGAANYVRRNSCFWVGNLSAGSHTIKGRLASVTNGQTTTVSNRTLLIYILNGTEYAYVDSTGSQSSSSETYADDANAQVIITPTSNCTALMLYGVSNVNGATERYNGKKILINVGGTDITACEAQKSSYNTGNHGDSLTTVYAQNLTTAATTIKGRFARTSTNNVVSVNRSVMAVLLLDPSKAISDIDSSTTQSTISSTSLANDAQASITRNTNKELLVFAQATKKYTTSGSAYGMTYGVNIDDDDVTISRSSPAYSTDAESNFVAWAQDGSAGSHTINGRMAYNYGTTTSYVDERIMVALWLDNITAPTANFTANHTSGSVPLTVAFTDTSTESPTSWSWNFGDGQTSTSQNPTHTYSTIGTYTVTLNSTNSAGSDVETKTNYITVNAVTPVAAFSANVTSGYPPLTVRFTDASINVPTSWTWNFGDGNTANFQNTTHTYNTPGTYTVTLNATNSAGSDVETKTNYITISTPAPTAAFSANVTSGVAPLTVTFTDSSTNSPTSWSWNFGDGQTSTSQNPSHTYNSAGTYTVVLTATNAGGSDGETKTGYITVTAQVVAGFSSNHTIGAKPFSVAFTDTSTGSPTSWNWNFGDGNTSTEQNPTHTYLAEGQYTVTFTTLGDGGENTTTQTVDVMLHAPRYYGGYVKKVFQPNMTSWDFMGGISSVYRDSVGDGLFYLILWFLPYLSMWSRQGSTVIISILYLFTGSFVATVLPAYWGGALLWMMVLGTAGIIYRIFIPEN